MYRASIASIIMQNIEEIAFIEDISDIALLNPMVRVHGGLETLAGMRKR